MLLALESTSSRMSRLGRAVLSGSEILSLDEVAARVDAVTPRGRHGDRTPSCSRPSASRSPASGPITTASATAVGGEVALLEAVA